MMVTSATCLNEPAWRTNSSPARPSSSASFTLTCTPVSWPNRSQSWMVQPLHRRGRGGHVGMLGIHLSHGLEHPDAEHLPLPRYFEQRLLACMAHVAVF